MKNHSWLQRGPAKNLRQVAVLGAVVLVGLGPALRLDAAAGPPQHYQQTNLVSDEPGLAKATDPHLVNPWGLARSGTGPWWSADNGTGLSTVYNGAGAIQSLVVTVPAAPGGPNPSAPTGIVSNGSTSDFLLVPNTPGTQARFIFVTEEGTVSGWNSGTSAVLKVNKGGSASYKGATLGQMNGANYLYAANFLSGRIDVFDRLFAPVTLNAGAFRDPEVPADYSPFNVENVGGLIYVMFAKKEAGSIEEVPGPGRGYVSAFSTAGVLQKRLRWGAWFDAPWGIALASPNFGGFSNLILVGQFGSGKIAAFDPVSGEFRGLVRGAHGRTMIIEGLWALGFGNDASAGSKDVLYFTAGIDDEAHGLFGTITPLDDDDDSDQDN